MGQHQEKPIMLTVTLYYSDGEPELNTGAVIRESSVDSDDPGLHRKWLVQCHLFALSDQTCKIKRVAFPSGKFCKRFA